MIKIVRRSSGSKPPQVSSSDALRRPATDDFAAQVSRANQKERQAEQQAEKDALLTLREDGTSKDGGFSWQVVGPAAE